jgi:hypothetical protein
MTAPRLANVIAEDAMGSRKLAATYIFGWSMLGASALSFAFLYYGIGPDWTPLVAVFLLVAGILWWLKAVPTSRIKFAIEDAAKENEAAYRRSLVVTGDESILRAAVLRLNWEWDRWAWLSEDHRMIGSVVGTHASGRIWVTAIDSDERVLLQLRCARPGAWYHYGYKRKLKWSVCDPDGDQTIGVIELRPTFLGRFKWPIRTEAAPDFGQVKAGVEWSRFMVVPAGALVAAVIPNLKHHATVSMRSRTVCAISWSARSAALTFAPGEWEPDQRKLAIGAASLLACCPKYYRHA